MISARRRLVAARANPLESATVSPDAAPYAGGDSSTGMLLLHGFSGVTKSILPWAKHVESAGIQVSAPRLPGHGTSWQELNLTAWTDWWAAAEQAFLDLRTQCDQVFVGGLSMGGGLALRLAEVHGSAVSGVVVVNPVIGHADPRFKILRVLKLVPSLGGITNDIAKPGQTEGGYDRLPLRALYSQTKLWALIQADLARVTQPLLVFKSTVDHVGDPSSLRLIKAGVGSADRTFVELTRSYHVATLDYDADQIFEGTVAFIARLTGGSHGPAQ